MGELHFFCPQHARLIWSSILCLCSHTSTGAVEYTVVTLTGEVCWVGTKSYFFGKVFVVLGFFFKKQPKTIFSESAKKEIHNKKNGWNFFQRYKNMIFYDAHMNQRRKTIHLGQEGKRHFLFLGSFKFVESNDMSALLMWQLLLSGVLLDRSSDLLHAQFLL